MLASPVVLIFLIVSELDALQAEVDTLERLQPRLRF
jgi:hypothetical protein